jgi:linoleoyl-CoA desaturase
MGIGMAGVGMNVMHDGNHGSYSNKTGSINSWVVRFIFLQETCTTGTTQCITPHLHEYSGHDEDLDAGRIIRFTKRQNGILSIASTILLCVFIWLINFQLGNNN